MSGAELVVLLAAVLLMILLGLHLLVVRPRRRRALRRLVQLRGGHYARGRANLPLSGGEEAFVGAKHLSVPTRDPLVQDLKSVRGLVTPQHDGVVLELDPGREALRGHVKVVHPDDWDLGLVT